MQCRQGGFTLVELAVIILIIAACVTVVFPKFSNGLLDQQRLKSSVSKIASIAEYARQRAVSTHLTHVLHFNIEQGTYWITAHAPDGKLMPMTDGLNLKGRLPEDIRFSGIDFPDIRTDSGDVVTIEFSPQGWIEPATVYVASLEGREMSIVMHEMLGYVETLEVFE
ncbi:MAG: pilus assembly FimT family protein [Planctomycetota bacterium]|jgi:Tfp pilus assembly protein FimT